MLAIGLGAASASSLRDPAERRVELPTPAAPAPAPVALPDQVAQPVRIRRGATFGGLAASYGLPAETLRQVASEFYDLAKIRSDRELLVHYVDGDAVPVGLSYAIDEDTSLDLSRVGENWSATLHRVEYASAPGSRRFSIQRSLWQDGLDAGLRPSDLVRLANIFEYELDFNTELRPDASFALIAEVLTAPGDRSKLGELHAVRLVNGDRSWEVYRYELDDGTQAWFRADGTSMKKPFLRSPLEFSRVTSGFNPKRYHPILKRRRPHNGTDFGAPTGTPVRAVAEGKVVRAGWAGGHGRFVKIQHDGGFSTSYSHLSKISVTSGVRVRQGQVVGAVGSSGLATGPHLHYQMWHHGRFIDPMKAKLPNQTPLPEAERDRFDEVVAAWAPELAEVVDDGAERLARPDGDGAATE